MELVSWKREEHSEVLYTRQHCLPEFSHINHYWDEQRQQVVAKILPGEFYMTTKNVAIATTLGSCISACIYDSVSKVGGMNHFMLPLTTKNSHQVSWGQRGKESDATRYGNFAMEFLINTILKNGGSKKNLVAKVFGGGKVRENLSDVGMKNIHFVLRYLATEQIKIETEDIGLTYPRKVIFEPATGKVFIKRLSNLTNDTIVRRESDYRHQIDENHSTEGAIELF